MMFCPLTEGQNRGRNNGNNGGTTHSTTSQQRSNNTKPGRSSSSSNPGRSTNSNSSQRPGNMGNMNNGGSTNKGNSGTNNRPGNNNNNVNKNPGNNNRPSGNVNNNRPGNNNPGGQVVGSRPGNGGWNTHKSCGNNGPHHNDGGNIRHGAPVRSTMPANRHWYRPTPPPSFRPYKGCPTFSTILGVTIGSALNYTLNSLINSGYNVLGYIDDAIYLSNVSMLNFVWPNATMYYTDNQLRGSEFVYSSTGYDRSRYSAAYNNLVRLYGSPVSVQSDGNYSETATWWGYNNSYVTLSFYPDYATNGVLRYYTTLSFGN